VARIVDPSADIHDSVRSLMMRARLIAANKHANNHVIVTGPPRNNLATIVAPNTSSFLDEREDALLLMMDRWLGNLAADRAPGTVPAKVLRNRPADLADGCWAPSGEWIAEPASYEGEGRCHQMYPPHGDPRTAAGAPLAGDILKCALEPIRVEDYAQPMSVQQIQRLQTIFPSGVCDYSRPGVGQQLTRKTWQRY
jgi:hypothetical protein